MHARWPVVAIRAKKPFMKIPQHFPRGRRAVSIERVPDPVDGFVELGHGRIATRQFWRPDNRTKGGPVLVFLHEALGCNTMWKRWPRQLASAAHLPFLSYDRYGHGLSDPLPAPRSADYLEFEAFEILPRVLQACGITDPILFGHSDGGSIALMYASRFPVRAVVTEAAHVFVEDVTLAGIREAVRAWRETDLPQRLARHHGDKTEALFQAWADTWLSDAFASWNIEDCLPRIKCPLLAIQGADDEYGTARQVEAIVNGVSGNVRSLMLPDCKHIPHLQAEDRLLPLAAAFIADCRD